MYRQRKKQKRQGQADEQTNLQKNEVPTDVITSELLENGKMTITNVRK